MGTVAAAAMRRVYEELEHKDKDDLEVKRWRWYQRYYQAITENPVGPLWKALPDPVDFFAETPPAKDPSVPPCLCEESENARRHFYLLIKLGVWLANLPVRVSTIATLMVMYVRRTEGYGVTLLSGISFYWNLWIGLLGVVFHLFRRPQWVVESAFLAKPKRSGIRPLFGWAIYSLTILVSVLLVTLTGLATWLLHWYLNRYHLSLRLHWIVVCSAVAIVIGAAGVLALKKAASFLLPKTDRNGHKRSWLGGRFLSLISGNLDIARGLLHPYEIKRAIYDLFVKDAPDFVLHGPSPDAVKALFVCAALEETDQIVLTEEMPIVEALSAAVVVPGVLPPQCVERKWVASKTATEPKAFQVLDGATVRTNPLPAFFDWCKHLGDPGLTSLLQREDGVSRSLHVVYSVPTGYDGSVQDVAGIESPDIVESAQKALQLAKRRDTRQEVRQTNNLSRLEWHRRQLPNPVKKRTMVIFADEIAPREEIDLGNELSPDHEKLRRTVADGCRATLETLYREEILALRSGKPDLPCGDLLRSIAPRRAGAIGKCGGLKAVCDRCTGVLQYRPEQNPNDVQQGVLKTYGRDKAPDAKELTALFPQLAEEKPKVVFLGSGGVFRGAFHIGVLAAMHQTKLYPDLVIGASVGTLMGGALCRMTAGSQANALQALSDLAALFVRVDEKVSLTFTLKSAAKQLGIRAREVRLSPSELARKVRQGSKADAGYAATGAPPVLTDALSYLFTIPHRNTATITSQFVAGHFSDAVVRFLREVRRETLPSFDIQKCVMGVSLLEKQARTLLAFSTSGDELNTVQPYQGDTPSGRKVAFFGTTSFLNGSTSLLLGRDFLTSVPSWNATQGSLCSSAFPAVFAPRMEADLMPGAGRTDRYFADGGMFDNLPFFPALEVLGAVQHGVPFTSGDLQEKLAKRAAGPNLIISAGLNEEPAPDANVQLDTMFAIKARAKTLSYQSKTDTFTKSAGKAVAMLEEISSKDLCGISDQQRDVLNGFVAGTVVGITPTDAAHINPTFAFCKSLGLRRKRVQTSIGDGCYRSLLRFSEDRDVKNKLQTIGSSVTRAGVEDRDEATAANLCPYFEIGGKPFECPFTQTKHPDARAVYDVCSHDTAHS